MEGHQHAGRSLQWIPLPGRSWITYEAMFDCRSYALSALVLAIGSNALMLDLQLFPRRFRSRSGYPPAKHHATTLFCLASVIYI
jgi:hypothetical protein